MAIVLDGTTGITTPDLTDTSLTSGRVVYAGTGGNLTGSANLTFDGSNLICGGTLQALGTVQSSSGADLSLNANGANRDVFVKVNGTTLMTVQGSTARVGIGTATPATKLDVSSTTAVATFTTTQTSGNAVTINVDGSSGTPVGLRVAAGFGTIGSTAKLINVVDSAGGNLFNAQASGVIAVGSGIQFPATQSASSDANTLDDYEEGAWTPTDASGAGLSITNLGSSYTRIGRLVTCKLAITYPTTASVLLAAISGLPFTSGSYGSGTIQGFIVASTATITMRGVYGNASSTTFNFDKANATLNATNVDLSGTTSYITIIYQTAT